MNIRCFSQDQQRSPEENKEKNKGFEEKAMIVTEQTTDKSSNTSKNKPHQSFKDWITSSRYISVVLGSIVALVVSGGFVYYYYNDEIHAYIKSLAVDVTSSTIEDEKTHTSAVLLTSKLAEDLLSRLEVISNATEFVKTILNNEQTLAATVDLLVKLASEERTQIALAQLTTTLVHKLANDPSTVDNLAHLLHLAIDRQDTRDLLIKVMGDVLANPELQKAALLALTKVTHDLLENEEIRQHSIALLKTIISDSNLQQATGSALWQTVRAAVSPSWFKKHSNSDTIKTAHSASSLNSVENVHDLSKSSHEIQTKRENNVNKEIAHNLHLDNSEISNDSVINHVSIKEKDASSLKLSPGNSDPLIINASVYSSNRDFGEDNSRKISQTIDQIEMREDIVPTSSKGTASPLSFVIDDSEINSFAEARVQSSNRNSI